MYANAINIMRYGNKNKEVIINNIYSPISFGKSVVSIESNNNKEINAINNHKTK